MRAKNRDAIAIYTPEDMGHLLRAASPRYLPCLAGFAGFRSAEVERLEWSEVHLADYFIEIKAGQVQDGIAQTSARGNPVRKGCRQGLERNAENWQTPRLTRIVHNTNVP